MPAVSKKVMPVSEYHARFPSRLKQHDIPTRVPQKKSHVIYIECFQEILTIVTVLQSLIKSWIEVLTLEQQNISTVNLVLEIVLWDSFLSPE